VKTCRDCGATKPLDDFYVNKGCRDGRRPECKACNLAARAKKYRSDPRPAIERAQRWQRENPERHRATQREYVASGRKSASSRKSHLKRKYGLTLEAFDQMLASQGGGCAICGRPDADNVDHDHETGRVRGILCWNCNIAVGQFEDSVDRVVMAAGYLSRDDELAALARSRAVALAG
jgi:Recombination endonuclease VII